jgi:hypothetical protein
MQGRFRNQSGSNTRREIGNLTSGLTPFSYCCSGTTQSQLILISALGLVHEEQALERRLMLLPLIWGAFGIGEVLTLQYLLNPISSAFPAPANDKPISGSLLPFLFISTAMVLIVLGVSLYSIGYWEPKLSTRKAKIDIAVLTIFVVSGLSIFYTPFALFPLVLTGFYFLAVNLE